jgi:hypothetical protein
MLPEQAYMLIPAEWSLLRNLEGVSMCYLLDESDGFGVLSRWASGRFLDPALAQKWEGPPATCPSFGFCGQLPGVSKQVVLSPCTSDGALIPDNTARLESNRGSSDALAGRCESWGLRTNTCGRPGKVPGTLPRR